ncbi:MAG: Gfo/Idh/MocA family oxidoreductase [Candidatus Kryptoniota bacterium]
MKLAILGCGRWGINHVRTAHRLFGEKLVLVSDLDPSASDRVKKISSSIRFTTNPDEVINGSDIDAVIVATPAATHYTATRRLLLNGKNVLVEKPITLEEAEARELIGIADKKKLKLMVGHVLLYHPAVLKLKELIDAGKIGKLQYLYSNRLNFGTVRTEENILWSFAPHDISVMQFLLGSNPDYVEARGATFLQTNIEDSTITYLSYPGNIHAHIFVSWLHPFKEQRLVVIGDKGMMVFEDSAPGDKLKFYPKGFNKTESSLEKFDGDFEVIHHDDKQPLAEEQCHFIKCVTENRIPLTDGKHALEVLQILRRAERSLKVMQSEAGSGESNVPSPADDRKITGRGSYFVSEHAVVDDNVQIGEATKIWHFSHVQSGARIGHHCSIGQNVNVANNVTIGNYVKIQNNVSIYEGVELEDYVFCGPSMVFTNIKDPRSKYPQAGSKYYIKTLVREGASLGANCTIICGHNIGRYAFVGAGAVVTKEVPDFALVVGSPAKLIGWVSEAGQKLKFDKNGIAYCEKSKKKYKLENGSAKEVSS